MDKNKRFGGEEKESPLRGLGFQRQTRADWIQRSEIQFHDEAKICPFKKVARARKAGKGGKEERKEARKIGRELGKICPFKKVTRARKGGKEGKEERKQGI